MRTPSRKSISVLFAVPLLLVGCGSSGSSPAPASAPASGPATAQAPAAPTAFTALVANGTVPCPSPDPNNPDSACKQTNLAWTSTSAPDTWFRVYGTSIGEDPSATCAAAEGQTALVLETKPGATSGRLFDQVSVGAGPKCLWITAVGAGGESQKVPAQGQ
jgi:hypothetical protein